jgi:hypothetical protein
LLFFELISLGKPNFWFQWLIYVGFIDYYEEIVFYLSSLSLGHQSSPEQSVKSRIDGRHFDVYIPIDSTALLFCAWMMNEGQIFPSCLPLTNIYVDWFMVECLSLRLLVIEYLNVFFIISLYKQLNTLFVFNTTSVFLEGTLFSVILMKVPSSLIGKISVLLICEWQCFNVYVDCVLMCQHWYGWFCFTIETTISCAPMNSFY